MAALVTTQLAVTAVAGAATVVKKPGTAVNALSDGVARAARARGDAAPKVIDLSGDPIADSARIARESKGEKVIYALGPDAVAAAAEAKVGARIVALNVPNPARATGAATYFSIYPQPERVFAFLRQRMNARAVGFLHSPAQNREVAASFATAAQAAGITFVPIGVTSSGELVRDLKSALPKIDALILAVDPIVFDRQKLRFIVEAMAGAKKPSIGFLPELTTFGVTISLSVDPAALAQAAVAEGDGAAGARAVRHLDQTVVTVSRRSAEQTGLAVEKLGATTIH
jgi:ABC-type uncharacterized transport system substrate-binding protein